MQCATCTQPILHACLTAACGHCFHDVCAETLCSSSHGKSCCPECDAPITAEELWRTYVDCDGSSPDSQPAPTLSVAQDAIEWRRAVRVARQVDQAERLVASTCAALRQEDRALADLAKVERELHAQTAAASARAAAVRKRSLHSAVLVGATVSFNRLKATAHAGVRDEVKALAREHGHSKQQLCAVLQLLLFRLQKAYAHKLAELGSLREAERTARRRPTVPRRPAVAADAPPASAPALADPQVERGEGVHREAAAAEAEGRRVERRGSGRKTHSFLRLARGMPKSAAGGEGGAGLDQTSQGASGGLPSGQGWAYADEFVHSAGRAPAPRTALDPLPYQACFNGGQSTEQKRTHCMPPPVRKRSKMLGTSAKDAVAHKHQVKVTSFFSRPVS